jgi:hypothetical protein
MVDQTAASSSDVGMPVTLRVYRPDAPGIIET